MCEGSFDLLGFWIVEVEPWTIWAIDRCDCVFDCLGRVGRFSEFNIFEK